MKIEGPTLGFSENKPCRSSCFTMLHDEWNVENYFCYLQSKISHELCLCQRYENIG